MESVRIDRWLTAARVYRSRSLATQACASGHVSLDDCRAKPSSQVRIGARIEARRGERQLILEVIALGERRRTAREARALYVDHSPPPPDRRDSPYVQAGPSVERGRGRPTKRDRRRLDRIRR